MPDVADLPYQPLLIVSILTILLIGILGFVYASRPTLRRARPVQVVEGDDTTRVLARRRVRDDLAGPATVPTSVVAAEATDPMPPASPRRTRSRQRSQRSWRSTWGRPARLRMQ